MTSKNIYRSLGGLDLELIAKAAPTEKVRKKKTNVWVKWALLAACLTLAMTGMIISVLLREHETFELPTDINSIIWKTDTGDEFQNGMIIPLWEGWRVDASLYHALENEVADRYFALHISKECEDSFVYKGKTLAEIQNEQKEKYASLEKLGQLLKDGDILKHGKLVYTTGTPEGEKWSKALYDETIAYYGNEFLAKYIAEGEFDRVQAEKDYESISAEVKQLEVMYDDACKAYHHSYLEETEKVFSDLGLCTIVKNNKLFVFVQKEELARLAVTGKESYRLSLAKRRNYEHEEGDIPTYKKHVTGFALEKIQCETFDHSSQYAESDEELIEKINALIVAGQFDTDRIRIWISSSEALSEDVFKDINYESITVTNKYKEGAFAWMYVKYENINLEALRELSNMKTIESIRLSLDIEESFQ